MIDIDLEKLLDSGAHFGHQSRRWNPKMAPYLFGVREGIHVFDLIKTREMLQLALSELSKTTKEKKIILLVGTKKQVKEKIAQMGEKLNVPYVSERWLGGTLTNFNQIASSVRKLSDMKEKMAKGEYANLTKKERLLISREIEKLEKTVGGLRTLSKKPDLIFIVDTHKEFSCVKEANMTGVPIVGITDSNADPSSIDFPIPMNDDASKALDYVLSLVEQAIIEGGEVKKNVKKSKKN
ncbi:30S ribosomal protein S2 [Candidatus Woesebacteria bacterium]|nr:30S ribosomal protein S2 [Candidatus Woesebacteria bacterium]QQG47394.1 MAG: 30S ribosomal protein S2 [Candidatus Woesebacteria bacterium]